MGGAPDPAKGAGAKGGKGWGGGGKGCGKNDMMQMMMQQFGKGGWGGDSWGGKGKGKGFKVLEQNRDCTIWLGGLPEGLTHEEIKENFTQAGTVKRVQLLKAGTGLAWFSTAEEATKAITMFNGSVINGATLQVDVWSKKE